MKIHIYLDYQTKNAMNEIRQKYKVSLSTIADVLINQLAFFHLTHPALINEYLIEGKKEETCIILNKDNKETFMYGYNLNCNHLRKLITNLLYIMAHEYKYLSDHGLDKSQIGKVKMNINNELNMKREIYWDYNKTYRQHVRAQKQYRREYEER